MVIGLRISIDEFDNAKQLTFRQGIANAAVVAVGKVTITSIKSQTTGRRHLLVDGIRINVEIAAKDANAAVSVANKLSVENINAQLSKVGLPEAEVLSVPIVYADAPPPAESEDKSNHMTVIVAAVCAGVGAVVLGAGVCMYRRRRTLTKADLETEGVFPPRSTNDLDTNTSGENHMSRLANNMPASQEAITDGNSTLESADSEQAHVGQYQPVDTHEVFLDSVVMNLLGNDPAAILSSPSETVPVRAYELIDFSAPADQVKKSIARQIRNLNIDRNQAVRVTADHGFMARPTEKSSMMLSVSSRTPENAAAQTTRAGSRTASRGSISILPSLTARVTARAASPMLAGPDEVEPRPSDGVDTQPLTRNVGAEFAGRMRVMAVMNSIMPPEDSSDEDDDQDAKA